MVCSHHVLVFCSLFWHMRTALAHVFQIDPRQGGELGTAPIPFDGLGDGKQKYDYLSSLLADSRTRGRVIDTKMHGIKHPVDILSLTTDPNVLYISQFMDNQVSVLHRNGSLNIFAKGVYCKTPRPCALLDGPWGLAQLGNELFVASFSTDQILVFDINTGEYLTVFGNEEELNSPEGLVIGSDGLMYVSSHLNNEIVVYNPATKIKLGVAVKAGTLSGPEGLTFMNPNLLAVTSHWSSSIFVYHCKTGELLREWNLSPDTGPVGIIADDDEHVLVSLQGDSNKIVRLNINTGQRNIFAESPKRLLGPSGMAWIGKEWWHDYGKSLVVASYNTNALLVFNISSVVDEHGATRQAELVAALT